MGHSTVELERSTVEHHYDLTPLIWSSEDMYMSNFHVVVTATLGGNHSQPAKSDTFTFNIVETAIMTCESPAGGGGSEVICGDLRSTV